MIKLASIIFLQLILVVITVGCKKKEKVDAGYVVARFKELADSIRKVAYHAHRIDTFPRGQTVWNNRGMALIEKDSSDELFGFSFYAKRDDVAKAFIYDKGMQFEVNDSSRTYQMSRASHGFLGSPGGQMIYHNLFFLDSIYKSRVLEETESRFILTYQFDDDTVYNVSDIVKVVELSKNSFFPVQTTITSKVAGFESFSQTVLTDVRINKQVQNSIKGYKNALQIYSVLAPSVRKANQLIGQKFPQISLPDLLDQDTIDLMIERLTLIDFWETWCGPCIASLPKVQELKERYSTQLNVIGIISEDREVALRFIQNKGITYYNFLGSPELLKSLNVNSWPTYFLIDDQGIVRKEYVGFSEQIEEDIKMLSKGI